LKLASIEFPHQHHVAQHLAENRVAARLPLRRERTGIGMNRDRGEAQRAAPMRQFRIDEKFFWHLTPLGWSSAFPCQRLIHMSIQNNKRILP
jgi:2-polyprenyl-6-methoxyphenol hydroxylase-like FAD-dependent oxidoreductase